MTFAFRQMTCGAALVDSVLDDITVWLAAHATLWVKECRPIGLVICEVMQKGCSAREPKVNFDSDRKRKCVGGILGQQNLYFVYVTENRLELRHFSVW